MQAPGSRAARALRTQWMLIALFIVPVIPTAAVLAGFPRVVEAMDRDAMSWEFLGAAVGAILVGLLQGLVARDGAFGICAFPPVARIGPGWLRVVRAGELLIFSAATTISIATILRAVELHVGLVATFVSASLWLTVFGVAWLALGYEQAIPRGLRGLFAPDPFWLLARLRGRRFRAERSCLEALDDELLPVGDRLFALELVAHRPWLPGAADAVRGLAESPHVPEEMSARAREILATVPQAAA